ncbi:NAD(P)/FAD-dependent oxidoreductase [Desulfogranum japonicum]|uniref:NAD(P)/FAD-dependent oxidoreductase n=1 Tax=Desulfogranum japonicum TaxID=231447 RepID=UPI00041D93F3|nr:FAD/NAD(P)-binding oxidoreductase [Desulfogranum japonicum]
MTKDVLDMTCDVAIVGGGPAGLGAAVALKQAGVANVTVLDRESEPGGVPRHCGHPPFGIVEFKRICSGPVYARRLVQKAREEGVKILSRTTVLALHPGGELSIASPQGQGTVTASKVVLATGVRETPRAARLVSGGRMHGICTTGALQSMVYLKNLIPFRKPVIIGSEIVSFSALLTCRRAGIKPVAMLEENASPSVVWPVKYAAALLGVRLQCECQLLSIYGNERVEGVQIRDRFGVVRDLECDGVLFTGAFTPEASLVRMSHLQSNKTSGSPVIDETGHCSDSAYLAAGNLLSPANVAMKCWADGRRIARSICSEIAA